MDIAYMTADEQDHSTAFVSHLPHAAAYALANAVQAKEERHIIFDLASGGFRSTVRLAKSSCSMWKPIFEQNNQYVVDSLDVYIKHLKQFRDCIKNKDFNKISNDRNIEPSEVTENVYRNLAYNFRIEFPKGWKIEPGNDIDIIQKATFENSGIVIGIQKLNLQGSHEPSSVQDAIPLKTFIDQLEKVFDIIELIDYGEAIVNNEPSYWVEYLYMDANIVLEYFFLRENILYSVSARTVPDEYPGLKPLFIETITSFVFENE